MNFPHLISSLENTPIRSISSSSGNMPSRFWWTYSAIVELSCNKMKAINYRRKVPKRRLFRPPCAVWDTADKFMMIMTYYMTLKPIQEKTKRQNNCWRIRSQSPGLLLVTSYPTGKPYTQTEIFPKNPSTVSVSWIKLFVSEDSVVLSRQASVIEMIIFWRLHPRSPKSFSASLKSITMHAQDFC